MTATLKQGNQVLSLILQHSNSASLQQLMASGLLTDLLQGDVSLVDRDQFRELIGLPSLNCSRRNKNSDNPLERYPWLGRKFCFTAIDLRIHDQIRGTGMDHRITRTAAKDIHILPLVVSSGELLRQRARAAVISHKINRCEILDCHGQTLGSVERVGIGQPGVNDKWYPTSWGFDLEDARFMTLQGDFRVFLYEITHVPAQAEPPAEK